MRDVMHDRQISRMLYLNVVSPHCSNDQHSGCWPPKAPDGEAQNVQCPGVLSRLQPSMLQPSPPVAPSQEQTEIVQLTSGSHGTAIERGYRITCSMKLLGM